ncbi:hypothetical protein QQ045_025579 [Rhodiola kirilowii]
MSPKPDHQNLLPAASTAEIVADECEIKKADFRQDDADHPPDSFWLSKDAELDWFDRNAFFERNYSTKGNSTSSNLLAQKVPQQLRKSKASIIWIPKTQRRSSFPETKLRRVPPLIRLVPRRTDAVIGKAATGVATEPSSPKVSCTGRVRQKKGMNKAEKKQSKNTRSRPETPRSTSSHRRLWKRLRDVFRSGKLRAIANEVESPAMRWRTKRSNSTKAQHSSIVEPIPVSLNRLASGGKSDSWIT